MIRKAKTKRHKPHSKKPKCYTVSLNEGMKPQPTEQHASRSKPEKVRFCNTTQRGRTVHFDLWPFVEPPEDIQVKAGKCSPCYTIYTNQPLGGYGYSVTPALDPGGPPGGPEVVIDP